MLASVYAPSGRISHVFYVKVDSDPEVLQRARWYADTLLWTRVALFLFVFVLMCSLPYVTTELGKRALVADTALWARIALSLSVV